MKTSEEWSKDWLKGKGVIVVDPDGWDREADDFYVQWSTELISEEEFGRRVSASTIIICNPKLYEDLE